jgi:hypothetical protein
MICEPLYSFSEPLRTEHKGNGRIRYRQLEGEATTASDPTGLLA